MAELAVDDPDPQVAESTPLEHRRRHGLHDAGDEPRIRLRCKLDPNRRWDAIEIALPRHSTKIALGHLTEPSLTARREGVVTVRILVPDLAVLAMDHQFAVLALGD